MIRASIGLNATERQKRMSNEETWKQVPGYEDIYEASNLGRIRSYHRHKFGAEIPHVMIPANNKKGYPQLVFTKNGKPKTRSVHRIIAETFIPNYNNLPQINHIDLNKENNRVDNLEWCDGFENMRHAYIHGVFREKKPYGIPVRCIESGVVYASAREAYRMLGISFFTIGRVCLKKIKSAGGLHFEFFREVANG